MGCGWGSWGGRDDFARATESGTAARRPPRKIVEASLQSAQTRVFFFSSPTRCSLQAENNIASQ